MPSNVSNNNKRIAKNTILLYVRMILIMIVTLYTSRVILQSLGVTDFGIYNVVGGVVAMMGILNGAMSASVSRYLTFELGTGNKEQLKRVFSVSIISYLVLAAILFILAETVGLWFVNTQLVISEERMVAANWVYQFSILSAIVLLIENPFLADIQSHERMDAYAYISIIEVVLRLLIAYLIVVIPADRLITYGILLFVSSVIITLSYVFYCLKNFEESHFKIYRGTSSLFKEMISYSGWNLFGSVAGLVKGQGLNILLNVFFNPAVNAARGIAYQVNGALTNFSTSFFTAVRPQIIKYYAQNERQEMFRLVFRSSRFSYYLLFLLSLPIIIEAPFIIQLWLGQLPDYVVPFVRIIILISMVDAIGQPIMTATHATGKIALYQSVLGTMTILIIPISYVFLKLGHSPITVFYVSLSISVFQIFVRLFILNSIVKAPIREYIFKVLGVCLVVSVASAIVPVSLHYNLPAGWKSSLVICIACVFFTSTSIWLIGMNKSERNMVMNFIKVKLKKYS